MPLLQYNGSIAQNIFSNASVKNTNTIPVNFATVPITWQAGVNSDLIGLTLTQILSNPVLSVTYSMNVVITGSQYYDDSSYPTTDLTLTGSTGETYAESYTADAPGSIGHGKYNVNSNFPMTSYPVGNAVVRVYNRCHSGLPGCVTYSATGFTMVLTLNIQVIAKCTGSNLESTFCSQYCLTNPSSCINDYISYCLTGSPTIPITSSQACQDFIQNYIETQGPVAQIDDNLGAYCQSKYQGFGDLFASPSAIDQELCACHMPSSQYAAFEQQLVATYPGFGNLGLVNECLLPQCASSPYKSVVTTGKCNLPQCLNIVSFNNDGTFNNSSVTINQNAQCASIVGTPPAPPPTPQPSAPPAAPGSAPQPVGPAVPPTPPSGQPGFWDRYKYEIIAIIALLVLLLIVIAAIIYFRKKNANK